MTARELSPHTDATCHTCRAPAANGLAIDGRIYCRPHGDQQLWHRLEVAAFDMLRCCGRDALADAIEGVETRDGTPVAGYVATR